jgi:CCR4-NOT transcriptional regulation complex NOT5 subunit
MEKYKSYERQSKLKAYSKEALSKAHIKRKLKSEKEGADLANCKKWVKESIQNCKDQIATTQNELDTLTNKQRQKKQ